jgi:trehalose 6-phosphate synthase
MSDEEAQQKKRLVVVSNRLPVVMHQKRDGTWEVRPGMGGLVTALAPVLRDRGGIWIGWPGHAGAEALQAIREARPEGTGYTLVPVALSPEEVEDYYYGFSNEILWPLFHDLLPWTNFEPRYFQAYRQVNDKFAAAVADSTTNDDFVWVQDYQLMLVAEALRERSVGRKLGFFLHIPFPPPDIFLKLPWRFQVLHGLLAFDLLGFQTVRDRRNFIQCVRTLIPGSKTTGSGAVCTLATSQRQLRVGAFPIGIDAERFAELAHSQEVADRAWYIHESLPDRQLILGVDRLDYTKGIPQRILAVGNALERYPELRGRVTFVQVVVPSREEVPRYQELKREIERLVGQINGQHTEAGWTPVHYIYRALKFEQLIAYYRTCEIALVTPLKDGMNLIAKEYCTCSVDTGVLVLSEFAGAASQLQHGALLVNPHDIEGTADAIHRAYHMPREERLMRMRRLRRNVASQTVFRWVDNFLRAVISRDLASFPHEEYYVPRDPETITG